MRYQKKNDGTVAVIAVIDARHSLWSKYNNPAAVVRITSSQQNHQEVQNEHFLKEEFK